MARRRRRGKVLKELKCGSGEALEVRTSQGRREAAPRAGQQEALPALAAGAQKCFVWGWNSAPCAASPTGALGLRTLQHPWGQHQARIPQSHSWQPGDSLGSAGCALGMAPGPAGPGVGRHKTSQGRDHQHLKPLKIVAISPNFCWRVKGELC